VSSGRSFSHRAGKSWLAMMEMASESWACTASGTTTKRESSPSRTCGQGARAWRRLWRRLAELLAELLGELLVERVRARAWQREW
jgi:hypothetical protein